VTANTPGIDSDGITVCLYPGAEFGKQDFGALNVFEIRDIGISIPPIGQQRRYKNRKGGIFSTADSDLSLQGTPAFHQYFVHI
jgi:hypothetical protein